MPNDLSLIRNVSDTALWVAYYRARETDKANALFRDPYAKLLIGDRGGSIAQGMGRTSKYTEWSIVIRTHIIDDFVRKLCSEGVDTVLNLGAGLDTRPYRLELPGNLRWIEVDYPHMIELKNATLGGETPKVGLERVALDLADRAKRQMLFNRVANTSKKTLILTEGVLPYLTEKQVAELASDIHSQSAFVFWIAEYMAPELYKYLNNPRRRKQMKNAPFQFFPKDWWEFFRKTGWKPVESRFLGEESAKLHRSQPLPWWVQLLRPFFRKKVEERNRQSMAYVLFGRV